MIDFASWPEGFDRLGWVLVHFLWQGAIIGAMAGAASSLLRRSAAKARYTVLCVALAVCALAPPVTWWVLGEEAASSFPAALSYPAPVSPKGMGEARPVIPPPTGPEAAPLLATSLSPSPAQARFDQIFDIALPSIVLLWSLGVVILSLRLIFGWVELSQVCAAGLPVQPGAWRTRIEALTRQMGIFRAIQMLESTRLDVPTLIGWFQPVLIVPATFFTSLPPDQVEAILAHEFAHIRRHDYLVNLLQILVETLLFYHPAIWWISRAIRNERENCCDDLAVQIVGDKFIYAAALTALEESRSIPPTIALAATGGTLLGRIRRVLGQREAPASRQAWFAPLVLVAVLVAIVGAGVYSLAEQSQEDNQDPFGKVNLDQGSLDVVNRNQMAFRNAVIADQVGLAEAFLRHGVQLEPTNIKSGIGDILADAVYFAKDPRMIQMLLAHGAKPAGDIHDWRSTVNHALKFGNKEIVDMLTAAGGVCDPIWYDAALGQLADLKTRDAKQPLDPKQVGSALDYAVSAGQLETFDWLWTRARTPDAAADAKKLASFYNRAAEDGHLPFMLHLEQMGVKPSDGGAKALENAVGGNHVAEAQHLFKKGIALANNPKWFRSPLGEAAGEGHLEMVALLLDHGADINARDGEGMTALCWAGYTGKDDVCQLLIRRGANLDLADKYGRTAVWYAAGSTHCSGALELMLKKGVPINWTDSNGMGLLAYAMNFVPCQLGRMGFPGDVLTPAEQRDYDAREERTIDLLISAGLNPSGKEGADTPLKIVFTSNHYPAARALLAHRPDLKIQDAQGNLAITYLFNYCHSQFPLDVLETLLDQGVDPNGSYPIPGLTPRMNLTVLQTALGSFRQPGDSQLAEHRAAVLELIQHGAKFPGVKNGADQALLQAAAKGDLEGMKDALAKGASPDAKDSFGYAPMLISMTLHYFDNALWLLGHGTDARQSTTMWGNELLPAAVEANRFDMVNLLLSKGVKPSSGASSGLDAAVENGNRKIFDVLLKADANPKDASIFTCIQYAQPEMARVLLDDGVDPQPAPFMENRANVYWAVCYNQPEILKMLLDHGADPTMMDAYGETPLSVAKEFHKEMVPVIEQAIQRRHAGAVEESIPADMQDLAQKASDAFQKADYDKAASIYQQIIKAHPDSLYAWSNLGVDRFQQNRYAEARDAFQRAFLLKPDDELTVADLGETYYRLEAYDDAVAALRTAILLDPNDANAHYFLGVSYASLTDLCITD